MCTQYRYVKIIVGLKSTSFLHEQVCKLFMMQLVDKQKLKYRIEDELVTIHVHMHRMYLISKMHHR